jgi:hypothetical protein
MGVLEFADTDAQALRDDDERVAAEFDARAIEGQRARAS